MNRLLAVLTSSFIFIGAQPLAVARTTQPNIVFFLVDDLGYMDIGAYNRHNFYETPNCDRIAAAGCRFTNGYAANPVCSPTRYSILTGRYPSRSAVTNFFAGRRGGTFAPAPLHDRMDLEEVTLAESLQEAGYATCFAGKWHLGPTEEFWPEKQGFDVNIGGNNRGMPRSYFSPYSNPRLDDGPRESTSRIASPPNPSSSSRLNRSIPSFSTSPFIPSTPRSRESGTWWTSTSPKPPSCPRSRKNPSSASKNRFPLLLVPVRSASDNATRPTPP